MNDPKKALVIENVRFEFFDDCLHVNDEKQKLNHRTIKALLLFLTSKNKIISKKIILQHLWEGVVVSDASIFKQIHLIKQLFNDAGLPEDCIENIYGRGYRLRYEVEEILPNYSPQQQEKAKVVERHRSQKFTKLKTKFFVLSLGLLLLAGIVLIIQKKNSTTETINIYSANKKQEIIRLVKSNWKNGKKYLDQELNKNRNYSQADKAFLLENLAMTENKLRNTQDSIHHSKMALALYKKLNDIKQQGVVHLNLAKSYAIIGNAESNPKRVHHIKQAKTFFTRIKDTEKLLDTQIALALYFLSINDLDESLKIFKQAQIFAQQNKDKIGEMLVINNLAVIYGKMNDYEKALKLTQDGLDLTLKIGEAQYIAKAYNNLGRMLLYLYNDEKALKMIQQTIKYQLSSHDYGEIIQTVNTLNLLLVQTFHYNEAKELIQLIEKYSHIFSPKSKKIIFSLYLGMNEARIGDWEKAEKFLANAYGIAEDIANSRHEPFAQSYLALSEYFVNKNISALQRAKNVMANKNADDKSKALASLTLSYVYTDMGNLDLAQDWFERSKQYFNSKWLFEYKLFLDLQLKRQRASQSILIAKTEKQQLIITQKIKTLQHKILLDEDIFKHLKNTLTEQIHIFEAKLK